MATITPFFDVHGRDIHTIWDSNSRLDLHLIRDLLKPKNPYTEWRRRRAQSALLAAQEHHLNNRNSVVPEEIIGKIKQLVPRGYPNGHSQFYGQLFSQELYKRFFPNWQTYQLLGPPVTGERVDDFILAVACEEDGILVTNEGWTKDGYTIYEKKKGSKLNLRGKAQAENVHIFSTEEYVREFIVDPSKTCQLLKSRLLEEISQSAEDAMEEVGLGGYESPAHNDIAATVIYILSEGAPSVTLPELMRL